MKIKLKHSPYFISGPQEIYYEIETWFCCRPWEVVLSSYVWDDGLDMFKREDYWVRECGLCGEPPRPRIEDRIR